MIETKKVYVFGDERYPIDLKAFGWEVTESKMEHTPDGLIIPYCILARNKEINHYDELHELELEYEKERESLVEEEEMEYEIFLLLLLLLIIPGIIYYFYKSNQIKGINEYNEPIKERMNKIVEEAKTYSDKNNEA